MTLEREPALIIAFLSSLVALGGLVFGWTGEQTGLVAGAISAFGAAYVAWKTIDTWASAIINAIAATLAVAIGFNLALSDEAVILIIGAVTTGLAMFNRTQVSPTETSTHTA